jgi:hypothetical protein
MTCTWQPWIGLSTSRGHPRSSGAPPSCGCCRAAPQRALWTPPRPAASGTSAPFTAGAQVCARGGGGGPGGGKNGGSAHQPARPPPPRAPPPPRRGDRRCMCTPACSHHASLPSPLHCHELTGDVAAAVAVAVEHADAWHDGSDSLDTASTLQQPTAALRDSYAADADAGRATTSCWQRTPSLLQRRRAGSAGAHTPAAVRQQQSAADKEEAGVCRTQGSASGSNGREPNGAAVGSSTTSDAAAPRGPQPSVLPTPPSSQALGSKGTADGLAARWASSGSCEVLAEGVVQPVPSVAGVLLATGLC